MSDDFDKGVNEARQSRQNYESRIKEVNSQNEREYERLERIICSISSKPEVEHYYFTVERGSRYPGFNRDNHIMGPPEIKLGYKYILKKNLKENRIELVKNARYLGSQYDLSHGSYIAAFKSGWVWEGEPISYTPYSDGEILKEIGRKIENNREKLNAHLRELQEHRDKKRNKVITDTLVWVTIAAGIFAICFALLGS